LGWIFRFSAEFGGVCGAISAKTRGSHNIGSFYPNGAQKGYLGIFGHCEANGIGFRAIKALMKRLFAGLSLWVLGSTKRLNHFL